jgi:hypothetical protein
MKTLQHRALALVAALVLCTASFQALAAHEPQEVQGRIVSVDAEAQSFTIETADGTTMAFRCTDATEVTGAEDGVAGLATTEGASVTVHYEHDADSQVNTAVRITIRQ